MNIDFKEECPIFLYASNPGILGDNFYISFYIGDCDDPDEVDEFLTRKMSSFTSDTNIKFEKIDEDDQGDDFEFSEMDDTITFKIMHIKSISKEVFGFLKSFIDIPTLFRAFKRLCFYNPCVNFHRSNGLKNALEFIEFLQNEFNNSLTDEERLSIET